jgi:hypothetical protein
MSSASIQVVVSDYSTSLEEWRRAQAAPVSELPKLSEVQKDVARKFGISEEEYARSVLAGHYGQKRMVLRARKLGEEVERLVRSLSPHYHVLKVVAEMFRGRWLVRIQTPGKETSVGIPRELGDDIIDSDLQEARQQLRATILTGLGLSDRRVEG